MTWATVTTCRGRCGHAVAVPVTWAPVLEQIGGFSVMVAWGCRDGRCARAPGVHSLEVAREGEGAEWDKCAAMRAGVELARSLGADRVALVDADARPASPATLAAFLQSLAPGEFGLCGRKPDGSDAPGQTGFVAFELEALDMAGGIPRGFRGYGQEDIAIRLALAMHGATPRWAPWGCLSVVQHSHDDRRREYPPELQNLTATHRRNRAHLWHLAEGWPGGRETAASLLDELDFRLVAGPRRASS